ncbi:MAG: Ig-like domain-containing protein [Lachnospiraceae bacterium]|nr:Ig-like domain-containing protein [Lachnospiraceae bacterium]
MKMKNKKFTRILSWLLVFAMILSLQPFSAMPVKAAGDEMNVTLHFNNSWGWTSPALQYWGGEPVVSDAGETAEIPGWGGAQGTLLTAEDTEGWYKISLKGNIQGFQFLDFDNTSNCKSAYVSTMTTYTGETPTDLYFNPEDSSWYLDSKYTEAMPLPIYKVTLAGASGLAGSNWSPTDENNDFKQINDTSQYTITYEGIAPGTYEYKILENNNWDTVYGGKGQANLVLELSAPANVTFTVDKENKDAEVVPVIDYIEFIDIKTAPVKKGESLTLEATYYAGDGETSTTEDITFATKEEVAGVTVEGSKVTVDKTVAGTELVMVATCGKFSQDFTIQLLDKMYNVTFYMYSQDFDMVANASDIYIFDNGKTGGAAKEVALTETFEDEENGITWLKGSVQLPYNDLGIIGRVVAGSWDGGQDADQFYTIDPDTEEITLWYVYGKTPLIEKPVVDTSDPRYLFFEYENKNTDLFTNGVPQFYSWTVGKPGYNATLLDMEAQGDGKYFIKVPVTSTCSSVSYVLVYDSSAGDWIKDGGDHKIDFPLDQTVLFVKMTEGGEPTLAAPLNSGCEVNPDERKIYFYYRDDVAVVDGTLADMKPVVVVNGTECAMEYNEAEKRFVASVEAVTGRTHYYFKVNGENILDKYNPKKETVDGVECSYVEYYKLDVDITAEVMNKEFNYNENNVVKLAVSQKKSEEVPELEVSKAYIDLSSLGGGKEVPIDPELLAVTISAKNDTALGDKTLPIVVMDQFNNKYKSTVDVKLVERTKDAKDFDWDEAVIYFMLTDRFFDGNTTNNTASGADTYGKNAGLYHGGDFAGLTAKLDYLKDLGVNTIWITPIVENIPGVEVTGEGSDEVPYNAAYHGYWASDFTKLNPTMGTEEEFKTLITEAHNRGMKIMVDVVLNHAGYGTEDKFGDMIRTKDQTLAGDDQKDSLSNLPDFVTEDSDVRAQLVKWQTDWMTKFDIDYYRVDTVKHVENTTWAAFKNSLTAADPTFKMIGEHYGSGYASNGGTLGTGMMDSTLDFDFYGWASSFVNGSISAIEGNLVKRNEAINNTYMTGQFLGSHDKEGFKQNLINNGMTEVEATALSLVAATLQITAKGQPVIYYGEELGQTGKEKYPYCTNRYDYDWSKANSNNETYNHYKKLLSIRNAYTDIFARGSRTVVDANDAKGYDIVKRTYADKSVWVGMNIANKVQTVTISGLEKNASYVDLYSNTAYVADANGNVKVTLPKSSFGGTVILAKSEKAKDVEVTEVTLSKTEATVERGKEITLTATVSPEGAKDKTVVFASDNEKVATVTADGVVKAVAVGTANITATTVNGKSATCKVMVIVPATKLYLNQNLKIKKGDTLQLTATVLPADSTDKLTWKSSNTKKVTVSETGKIKAVATGSATITVTSESGKKATCKVTVEKKAVKATKVTIKKTSKTMKVGDVKQLKLTVKPSRTTEKISFKSSKKSVVSVAKNGVMTAKKPGKATITATVGKKKASITITVKQPATGIELNKTSATLSKGKTLKLKATITPGNSTDKVTFKSSKKSVATVDSKGVVTAKKKGTATITAKTTSGKTAKCKITVK